jgi:hypothetical protein
MFDRVTGLFLFSKIGKSRGFGFVTLNNALSVKSILDIAEHTIDQKRVILEN